ncbi:MAG TPA: GapR family DNA-binding domain-containing protein [Gemmataceae bacterium]|nr:GapR family DNA-binding domain-containing protein [Gemmataceae bacterium]
MSADRSQIFKELKQAGYDRDTVRALVRRHKMNEEQRAAADALMDQYMAALGDFAGTPLGQTILARAAPAF